jgi:hypothetical protein
MTPISWIKKNGIGVCGVTPVNNEATGFEPYICNYAIYWF